MAESLKGQLLLASGKLIDPNFRQSVVLMVQHDENGAMGLVLNRPLETTVKDVCAQVLELPCQVEGPLHHGGPCEGPLMLLHTRESSSQIQVSPGLFFTTEKEQIEGLLGDAGLTDTSVKCFVGYAGWGAGQLEAEMEVGSWVTVAADAELVFGDNVDAQWQKLMTRATVGLDIDPAKIPEDPNLN
jgi:putative transcriptional regulator